jgi:hypothetical protein
VSSGAMATCLPWSGKGGAAGGAGLAMVRMGGKNFESGFLRSRQQSR